jgi:hypothetical protein
MAAAGHPRPAASAYASRERLQSIARKLPLFAALGIFLGHVAALYVLTKSKTDGTFCYPLDDTFIHMAIARTLAHAGVFGVTPHGFASASSSLAWPLLLAFVDRISGDHMLTPLALNVLAGALLVFVFWREVDREGGRVSVANRAFWVVMAVVLAPLPTIAVIGMEHTLHILVSLLFLVGASRWLAHDEPAPVGPVALLAFASTSTRYESLFLVGLVAWLALLRRRRRAAIAIAAAAAAPIVGFGLYSKAHGWGFLPSSVVLKGTKLAIEDASDVGDLLFGNFLHRICTEPHMIAVCLLGGAALVLSLRRSGFWSAGSLRLALALGTTFAHVEFARLSWFFRYEAYLVVMVLAGVALLVVKEGPSIEDVLRARWRGVAGSLAVAAVFVAGFGPLLRRSLQAAQYTPVASQNIFEQQMQSARFLKRYFPDEPVAVNDIGAVAYFGGQPIVDLAGLASLEVARAKRFQMIVPPPAEDVERLTRDASVAIVYDDWVPERPRAWLRVARWKIEVCRSCYDKTVSVYATRPDAIPRVVSALRAFDPSMPAGVRREGFYLDPPGRPALGAPDARLASGDTVRVVLPGLPSDDAAAVVAPDGRIELSRVGYVDARGSTTGELARAIDRAYARLRDPKAPRPRGPASVTLI